MWEERGRGFEILIENYIMKTYILLVKFKKKTKINIKITSTDAKQKNEETIKK